MTGLEAVVFDLDNTLCVPRYEDEEIHRRIFERVGVEPFFEPADVHAVDPADLPPAASSHEHYANLYRAVAERVDGGPSVTENVAGSPSVSETDDGDPSVVAALADATVEVLDPSTVVFREGARDAFRYVRDRYVVGILTVGYAEGQRTKIEALGIGDDVDAVVICDPATDDALKPDPEPFREVVSALDVSPADALYVGDSLGGDVRGAHNAGMESAWVPTGESSDEPDPEPTYVLDSPAGLRDVL